MSPLCFQGLDGAKGEKGVSGDRGPSGLPVSVIMSLFYLSGALIPITVMPLDLCLFYPGASWPARSYWAARNQRREGNDLSLMPSKYGCTFTVSLSSGESTPAPHHPRAIDQACGQLTRLSILAVVLPASPPLSLTHPLCLSSGKTRGARTRCKYFIVHCDQAPVYIFCT